MEQSELLESSDEQVISEVLAGRRQAFGTLVERYWRLGLAAAYSRCRDAQAAEDIAQDSFVKAYIHLGSLRKRRQFAGWLMKIVQQECTAYHRLMKRQVWAVSGPELLDVTAASLNPGLTGEQIRFVRQAVGKLPEHMQTIVLMRFACGMRLERIAEQIGKKYGTVRVCLHRACNILREELTPLLEEIES